MAAPLEHRLQHLVGDRVQHPQDDGERDDSRCGAEILLHRTAEQLAVLVAVAVRAGQVRLGVLAFALVVDRRTGQRLDHDPAEHERGDAGHRAGQQVADGAQ